MKNNRPARPAPFMERLALVVAERTGSSWGFGLACLVIIVWAITGPIFHFSDTWQLVINTGTTIVTFLMVFLIQRSQNKDTRAIELKLNELVAAVQGASNRLIDIEDLSEADLEALRRRYQELAVAARQRRDVRSSVSLEQAEEHVQHAKQALTEAKREESP